jgi:uncharacterized protein YpuA (DUF1002 family)
LEKKIAEDKHRVEVEDL